MSSTEQVQQRHAARPIEAARTAYQANRKALEPMLRLLLDAAALVALLYRRTAPKTNERESQAAS